MAEFAACKNGVSSLELSRKLQISYKSALFMNHRIRHAAAQLASEQTKITTVAEGDECYIGPRRCRKSGTHQNPINSRGKGTSKQPVAAVLERGGTVRTQVIARVCPANLEDFLDRHVSIDATLMTDGEPSYVRIGRKYKGGHKTVNHSEHEYVRDDVTTNRIEGFFSRVKRCLMGTYHAVSREHLHRYLSHVEFAYNTRGMNDGQRTVAIMRRSVGKRLMYRDYVVREVA